MLRNYPDVLNIKQMCEVLQVSDKTAYRLIQSQQIKALKIGRSYRIPKLSILHHLTYCPSVDSHEQSSPQNGN